MNSFGMRLLLISEPAEPVSGNAALGLAERAEEEDGDWTESRVICCDDVVRKYSWTTVI